MKVIEKVEFKIVIHSWLKDEWYNSVFDLYRTLENEKIINNPNFGNENDNKKRLKLFLLNRGPMYNSILENAEWLRVKIGTEDMKRIYYCYCKEWEEFSNYTFQPEGVYSNIFPDCKIDVERAKKIKKIIDSSTDSNLVNGLILIGSKQDSDFTIIEGCHRYTATSFKIKDKNKDEIVADIAFLGIHPEMNKYSFHIGNRR